MVTRAEDAPLLNRRPGVEVAAREDGTELALFSDMWQIRGIRREHPGVVLEPIVASTPNPDATPGG